MAKNKLTIKVDADTQEALKQMRELTEAANDCVAAFEKLEKKMNNFKGPLKIPTITTRGGGSINSITVGTSYTE
ncbi:hypothetical protein GTY48_15655 [Bacillus thuringiensis]|uniref:hypothetical protein n=1 Tax=Bacillus thuringiensis TaxID=1428 RepID=UPI001406325C|nr:hypothetical protein [Bacillus thuringiensis]MYW25003.1 hypothetical protein [Bacillus thuringiensis]MYW25082.1 hypothetical protein [Bacillus thuringiensis]